MSLLSYIKCPYKSASVSGVLFFYICLFLHCSFIVHFTIWPANSPQILKVITFSDFFFLTILAEFILPDEFWSHAVKVHKLEFFYWNYFYKDHKIGYYKEYKNNIFCGFSGSFLSSSNTFPGFLCFCKIHYFFFIYFFLVKYFLPPLLSI